MQEENQLFRFVSILHYAKLKSMFHFAIFGLHFHKFWLKLIHWLKLLAVEIRQIFEISAIIITAIDFNRHK